MGSYEKPALMVLLSLVPFFLGFVVKQGDKKTILAALSGYIVCIALGLRGTSRATMLVVFLVIPLSVLAVNWKYRGMRQISFLFKSAIFVGLILGSVFLIRPNFIAKLDLSDAWKQTSFRLTGHKEWAGAAEMKRGMMDRINRQMVDVRGAEARDFLDNATWFEYVAGNGFGVKWYSQFWGREWGIVHIGPVHLIYRGGIPLLVTYFLLLLFALRASWRNCGSDPVAMGCFVYLMVWTAKFFSYGAHQSSYYNYIFWLVVGLAFATDIKGKQEAPLAERAKSGFIRRAVTGIK